MDEDALVTRANEERERLFLRYERGREAGAEIDPWEDPGFEVYHQTDRYGFIHDKRLPQKIDPNEAKLRAVEMERVKKWLKMLGRWNSKETQEKLHKRIYKGIPDKLRSQVWMKLLNVEKTMAEKKDVYQNMLRLARQWSTEARQIDSDVNRQFREHLFYRERYSIKQRSLFNVLTAYSMYNMEVGYCQGMSGVAGVLLMYMDEEEAFWALSTLLADKKYAMHGLYIEGFPKLTRLVHHHDRIIEKFVPKLKKHFDCYNLDSMIYSLKWFFVIFIERIPFSLCLRVWDIYLLDGERVVTAMAYTILRLHQKKLLKLKDMDLLIQYLQTKLYKDFGYDDDYVIKTLEQSMEELKKVKMDLAPSPLEIEFPKRPFGVFVEPTFEKKIGRRKNSFTEREKDVTEKVILRSEKTQQELAESTISDGGLGGSNSQINTASVNAENWEFMRIYKALPSRLHARDKRVMSVLDTSDQYSSLPTRFLHGNIPESEDGCSLLGSSRKSLADTSVTSTADLSVFSIGQRSQQYDICADDMQSVHSDGEGGGESSPGSAFGSLSIVGRTPSAMMITPTPRAISPQDIVRIYVPPPPPEELDSRSKNSSSQNITSRTQSPTTSTLNKSPAIKSSGISTSNVDDSINTISTASVASIGNESGGESSCDRGGDGVGSGSGGTGISSGGSKRNSIASGDLTPVRRSYIYRSEEELTYNGQKSSSSSRRGSLSRKSPSLFTNPHVVMDCEHLKSKQRSINGSDDQIHRNSTAQIEHSFESLRRAKVMTSFEELARLQKEKNQKYGYNIDNRMTRSAYCGDTTTTTSEDEDFSPRSKYRYDSDIQYRKLATSPSAVDIDFIQSSPDLHYSRNVNVNALQKKSDNSDEYSSSSPNVKSVLTTPVNEQIPSMTMAMTMVSSQSNQKLLTSGETTPTILHNTSTKLMQLTSTKVETMTITENRQRLEEPHPKSSTNRYSAPTPIETIEYESIFNNTPHNPVNASKMKKNSSDLTNASSIQVVSHNKCENRFRPRVHSSSDRDSQQQYVQFTTNYSATTSSVTATALISPNASNKHENFSNNVNNISRSSANGDSNTSVNQGLGETSEISNIHVNNDFDRKIAASIGGPYDYKSHSNNSSHSSHNNSNREMNKIRIKVHQNQMD